MTGVEGATGEGWGDNIEIVSNARAVRKRKYRLYNTTPKKESQKLPESCRIDPLKCYGPIYICAEYTYSRVLSFWLKVYTYLAGTAERNFRVHEVIAIHTYT